MTDVDELLANVRAAARYSTKRTTREMKIALLRKHRWRRVASGKAERWESPDHSFVGTLDACYQRARRT
jgi:hypothetical protein